MNIFKLTFYSFLFLISYSTKAQNLSINSLIELFYLDIVQSENFLSKYKFTYVKSYEGTNGLNYLVFDYVENNKLIGKIAKTYNKNVLTNFVDQDFFNRNRKYIYVEELIKLGFKKSNSYLDGERIIEKYYKGILEVSITTKPNNNFNIQINKKI
jgi:hypothetical protein